MRFSDHFERDRADQPDRARITLQTCEAVAAPGGHIYTEEGEQGRTVYWGRIVEEKVRYLKVVVEPDGEVITTATFDATYRRKARRGERPQ